MSVFCCKRLFAGNWICSIDLLPRAPGDMINFKAVVAGFVAGLFFFWAIFYLAFTLAARQKNLPR